IPLPFDMKVAYQICLALEYKDRTPSEKPFSFIVMDGWFPCFMPYDDRPISDTGPVSKYIMTHGKWTIVGSYDTPEEAHSSFRKLDDDFIDKHVKQPTEKHMRQFWADFSKRFEYVGWSGAVLAKVKTDSEFRGTFVFQEPITDMICVFPGKITGIFDADRETLNLISGQSVLTTLEGYRYIRDGVLYTAGPEINADRKFDGRSTCELQTHRDLLDNKLDRGEIAISVRKRTGSIGSLVGLEEEVSCLSSKDMIMLCLGFGGVSVGGYCFGVEYAAPALGVWVLLWLCSKAPCIPASNIEFVERIRALGIFYRPGNWLGLDSPQFGGQNTETPLLKA
ncbi:MAG: hypothetical protein KDH94_03045, partial [Coxiellaceae bacterium]|nr:hypothetical protein [Coxiellaceae bacterium]